MNSRRLLIVSKRLPVTARMGAHGPHMVPSSGGLATGLRSCHATAGSLWIGSPGELTGATPAQREQLDRCLRERRIVPVHSAVDDVDDCHGAFANRVLWPVFHYVIDDVPFDNAGWERYRATNEAFAEAVAREYRPTDTIWVHDYQLMLVPALLRARLPHARIGFFLHIPFPSSEVFRVLPWRCEILNGLLGADLIGFHTFAYMRHFLTSLLHVEGLEADVDRVRIGGREVKLSVFPMGVDAAAFADLAASPEVVARTTAIRRNADGRRIVLGIDRLDYTKGIAQRFDAIECLLARNPSFRDSIRFIQVAVPTRAEVDAYRQFRKHVEERVGHINGAYGTVGALPVHYLYSSVSLEELVALYCAADVMLVTPLRDGMNVVAKEFVASRRDEDGVLVLSEFAGAAAELNGAVNVNPYDIRAVADGIDRALAMVPQQRHARMRSLRRRVFGHDIHAWAAAFLRELDAVRPSESPAASVRLEPTLSTVLMNVRLSSDVRLLLDYDGTLVPLARSPELAAPDDDLLSLLKRLAYSPGIHLDIVSGRRRETLDEWFGELPVSLWAEHGFWHRSRSNGVWVAAMAIESDWMKRVRPILDQFCETTPGSHVEVKSASLAWHYREAPREFATRQAHELRLLLGDVLSNQPLEVLEGKKLIEVRWRGVSKGLVAERINQDDATRTVIVAIGDDQTDEDLFRALPPSSVTVAVARPCTAARYRLGDYRAVRGFLRWLLREAPYGESALLEALQHVASA